MFKGTAKFVCNLKNNLDVLVEVYLYEIQDVDFILKYGGI
jgi:hypothetical protein